jgi:ferritin-like metal-binding protein YciE/DNA-binding HxlR family transcriptional regulator
LNNNKILFYSKEIPEEIKYVVKGLDDDIRLAILILLMKNEKMAFTQLKNSLGINSSSLSLALSILQDGGLVKNLMEWNHKSYSYYVITNLAKSILQSLFDTIVKLPSRYENTLPSRYENNSPNLNLLNQKFILELNAALAMENAGVERLYTRIEESSLPEVKQRLEHHLEESFEHQKILKQLVSSIGGQPTQEKLGLPLPSYPSNMKAIMNKTMTKYEYELKRFEEDIIVENAEVCSYLMLIQLAQMAGGVYLNAIDQLSKNMKEEQNQADWLKTHSPAMLAHLWPKIQSANAYTDSLPHQNIQKEENY